MKKLLINLLLMLLATVLLVWFGMLWLGIWTRHGDTITVPPVKDIGYDKAISTLTHMGLKGIVSDSVYDTRVAPGTVIEQNPKSGTVVKEGREVFLTITAFSPKVVTLPALTDISLRQARSILEGLDIKNIVERRVPSDFKDLVVGVRYKGSRLLPGARVPVNAVIELEVGEGMPEFTDSLSMGNDSTIISDPLDLFE